jgi:hypothetical protein
MQSTASIGLSLISALNRMRIDEGMDGQGTSIHVKVAMS